MLFTIPAATRGAIRCSKYKSEICWLRAMSFSGTVPPPRNARSNKTLTPYLPFVESLMCRSLILTKLVNIVYNGPVSFVKSLVRGLWGSSTKLCWETLSVVEFSKKIWQDV